jgi:hypothetical protein
MILKKHGYTLDVGKIAQGIWDMMPEDDRAPLSFGMMPAKWNDRLEQMIADKLQTEHEARYGFRPDYSHTFLDSELNETGTLKDFMREIMHEFYLQMLDCCKRDGKLIV